MKSVVGNNSMAVSLNLMDVYSSFIIAVVVKKRSRRHIRLCPRNSRMTGSRNVRKFAVETLLLLGGDGGILDGICGGGRGGLARFAGSAQRERRSSK